MGISYLAYDFYITDNEKNLIPIVQRLVRLGNKWIYSTNDFDQKKVIDDIFENREYYLDGHPEETIAVVNVLDFKQLFVVRRSIVDLFLDEHGNTDKKNVRIYKV